MIKTAGLSSIDPAVLEPERALAAFESAIVGLNFLTGRILQCLQTQAMEMVAKSVKLYWVCDMRYENCGFMYRKEQ